MLRSKLRSKWFTTAPRISKKELMRYKHTCTYLARLGTAVIGTLTISHAGPIWSSASRGAQKWCLQFGPPEKWPGPLRHLQSSRFHGVPCAWNFPEKREKGLAKASWDWCKENYVIVVALYWLCIRSFGFRNPEKFAYTSGILSWALESIISLRNPNDWNVESKFHWQRIANPVPLFQNPQYGIQNPSMYWITLHWATYQTFSKSNGSF